MKLTDEEFVLLHKLVNSGGRHRWATLSVCETSTNDRLEKEKLTYWTAREGEYQMLVITEKGRAALQS